MRFNPYKLLLYILRGLVFLKQGLFWFFKHVGVFLGKGYSVYRRTIGFYVYKIFFLLTSRSKRRIARLAGGPLAFLGRRGTMQVFLLFVIIMILVPQSKLYSAEPTEVPGRKTLLYQLVGPGDHEFDVDEIAIEVVDQPIEIESVWRQGSVVSQYDGTDFIEGPEEISSISSGGSALTKPVILPGVDVGDVVAETDDQRTRNGVKIHVVQPGDIIGKIAEIYRLNVTTILWANGLTSRSYIRPGDELKILPVDGVMHKVARGDTVSKIAKKYDTDQAKIVEQNKLQKDGSDIVIGEELIIPGGVIQRRYVAAPRSSSAFRSIAAPPPSVNAPAGSGYLWPTSVRRITQYFGWRHTGLDVAGPVGTPIYASKAGKVTRSQCGWNGGYGCYIIIDHGGGVQTLYAHNSQHYVSVGQQVSQGQTIAAMGSTGRSTGPHIHYEVRVNGRRQNPLRYIR